MTELKKIIAKNIKKYRQKAGLSQVALAKMMNIHSSSISNWEKGQNSIDIDTLFSFCKIVGVPIEKMVEETEPDYIVKIKGEPEIELLVEKARSLPARDVKHLLAYCDYIKNYVPDKAKEKD